MPDHVTIVGGGIGGLTHAIALARRGIRAMVLERAPRISEVGAGVQISPNGLAVLSELGLAARLRQAAVQSRGIRLSDGPSGRPLIRMPLSQGGYYLVHRAALIDMLAAAAGEAGVRVRLDTRVHTVRDGLAASFDIDHETETAPFVVGADGINSVVRASLNGVDRPTFTGQIAWRAIVACDAPPEAQVFTGPGHHLVAYPLGGGRLNLVAVEERSDWAEEGWHVPGDPAALRRAFAGFADPVTEWLDKVETCHLWGLFRHPVARNWYGRSVAILGDAAHPTLPFLGQGANLAIEDGWCLARAIAAPDRAAALAAYQSERAPRVRRAIAAANANARNYHLSGGRKHAAHAALRIAGLAPALMLKRFDWLYGHDVTTAETP